MAEYTSRYQRCASNRTCGNRMAVLVNSASTTVDSELGRDKLDLVAVCVTNQLGYSCCGPVPHCTVHSMPHAISLTETLQIRSCACLCLCLCGRAGANKTIAAVVVVRYISGSMTNWRPPSLHADVRKTGRRRLLHTALSAHYTNLPEDQPIPRLMPTLRESGSL